VARRCTASDCGGPVSVARRDVPGSGPLGRNEAALGAAAGASTGAAAGVVAAAVGVVEVVEVKATVGVEEAAGVVSGVAETMGAAITGAGAPPTPEVSVTFRWTIAVSATSGIVTSAGRDCGAMRASGKVAASAAGSIVRRGGGGSGATLFLPPTADPSDAADADEVRVADAGPAGSNPGGGEVGSAAVGSKPGGGCGAIDEAVLWRAAVADAAMGAPAPLVSAAARTVHRGAAGAAASGVPEEPSGDGGCGWEVDGGVAGKRVGEAGSVKLRGLAKPAKRLALVAGAAASAVAAEGASVLFLLGAPVSAGDPSLVGAGAGTGLRAGGRRGGGGGRAGGGGGGRAGEEMGVGRIAGDEATAGAGTAVSVAAAAGEAAVGARGGAMASAAGGTVRNTERESEDAAGCGVKDPAAGALDAVGNGDGARDVGSAAGVAGATGDAGNDCAVERIDDDERMA